MKRNKSKSQEKLYNFVIAKAFQQTVGSMFTYGELRKKYSVVCSTNDQREVGRRFAYWIKHTPGLPFDTVGTKNGSLLYQKISPHPRNHSNPSKGGVR
ncbi:cassette chromosome ssDNA-binding protein [Staphylococcus hominis]|uniref:cassette chromosome ssDNA-binding protein n=1 Tax=Staphylococcus hominis TaxID=1290 RepID=UPI00066CC57F|nr:hypothetical protein [Staphylococcus hominis]MDS3832742.1 hypothetical protein [Staphylococcus hominis]